MFSDLLGFYPGEAAALASAFAWSIAVIFMRLGGLRISSLSFNAFKASFAAICFLIIFPFTGLDWIYPLPWQDWSRLIISAIIGITLADWFYLVALRKLGAMLCAMLACFFPIFVMLCAWVMYGETMPIAALAGTGIVLLAVLLATYRENNIVSTLSRKDLLEGFFVGIVGELFMAIAIIMIRDIYRETPVFWVISFRFLFAGITMIPVVVYISGRKNFWNSVLPEGARVYVLLGSFFGPFLATICWFLGYKYALAGVAATLNKLSTFFIFILAAIFLKEPVTLRRVIAVILAFAGALVVTRYG